MYLSESTAPPLPWEWVDGQLRDAELYWVTARSPAHPRPVWGTWTGEHLHLSIGTPAFRAAVERDPRVVVHLDSALDVVIVEGRVTGSTRDPADVARYDEKYDYRYDAEQYGPFYAVTPDAVLAWRAAGPAGRDGFQETGRWVFDR